MKTKLEGGEEILLRLLRILQPMGIEVSVDTKHTEHIRCAADLPAIDADAIDLLLVVGGDGTILRSVRELRNFSIPILGINGAAVGFLAELNLDEMDRLLPRPLQGDGLMEERSVLHATVRRDGADLFPGCPPNDAVFSRGPISPLLELKARIGSVLLCSYHADGLIIATPTGSTAYSIGAGGPVVHPRISALVVTPINPHSLNQRPIVVPGRETIEVQVMGKENIHENFAVGLTLDGQVYQELQAGDVVTVRIFDQSVRFLRRKEDTFYQTFRTKLHWGECCVVQMVGLVFSAFDDISDAVRVLFRGGNDIAKDIRPVVSRKQRAVRFEIHHVRIQHHSLGNVRRIADDQKRFLDIRQRFQVFSGGECHPFLCVKMRGVFRGDGQCGRTDIRRDDTKVRSLARDGNGDASAAGTNVRDTSNVVQLFPDMHGSDDVLINIFLETNGTRFFSEQIQRDGAEFFRRRARNQR